MFKQYGLNIYDFDIYSRRIGFIYNRKDKIGTFFGLFMTFLYVIITLVLFVYYSIKTIERLEVKSHESTVYSQGLPSLNINPNLFYMAFGLENPVSLVRFIDERIYHPEVTFIKKEKVNGIQVIKEIISLEVERCDIQKFEENYQDQITPSELNNSYCLKDFNLTLVGGSKYNQSSYIEIKMHPCVNNTQNNNFCKSQNIIDSYLTSGYFSISIKDIGLNPLNYSYPIIPTIQYLKTNVDITMCRESLIYIGITEIHTDEGLFSNSIKKQQFLQYRKYSQSFYFINKTQYLNGNEIFSGQIKLEEYIHVQKREYTKMSEVFSITGGYMQLISTIFNLVNLFINNLSVEKKILNKLFNFNIKQRKLVLNIKYGKKLNCFIRSNKGDISAFIPFEAKKSLNHLNIINFGINNNLQKNDILISKTNVDNNSNNFFTTLDPFKKIKKINSKLIKNNSDKGLAQKIEQIQNNNNNKNPIFIEQNIINRSKMIMLFEDDDLNGSQISKILKRKIKKNINSNYNNDYHDIKLKEKETINEVGFNFFDYFCCIGKRVNKNFNIRVFNFGINFYRNQMNIINFFNILLLTEIMLTQFIYKKTNILNQIVDIPLKQ